MKNRPKSRMLRISRIVITIILITVMVGSSVFRGQSEQNKATKHAYSRSALPEVSNESAVKLERSSRLPGSTKLPNQLRFASHEARKLKRKTLSDSEQGVTALG